MPLFSRREPDLGTLMSYVVARSLERGATLNRTKLVKLLYLIDLERAAAAQPSLTGLHWIFFHYGPYALELPETLEPLEGGKLIVKGHQDAQLFVAAPEAPDGEDWPMSTRRQVDNVIRRFASMDLYELLDHVYFHTAPMRGAVRGQSLDTGRARSEPEPRPKPPLPPPHLSNEARERLAAMRVRYRERERLVPIDRADRTFLVDPDDERLSLGQSQRGRIVVSPDAEADAGSPT